MLGLAALAVASTLAAAPPPEASAPIADVRQNPIVDLVQAAAPAVVNISAESIVRDVDPFFGFFGLRGGTRRAQSLGSGLIVDPNGIVVTNAHVIEGASKITVITLDRRELEAEVLGSDRDADLAVLKVKAHDLPARPLGTSADLLIGETVMAIGNPFGLGHSVTTGVLSARGRSVPAENGELLFSDFLQTDASINPGNSGGPLLDLRGQVIGINSAIVSGATGIGFAIPADRARRVVDDLLRFGSLQPIWTGMRLRTNDPESAQRSGLGSDRGAVVERVFPGSPAERAGLAAGDVVVGVGGQPVVAREDVNSALYSLPVGEALTLQVTRDGKPRTVTLRAERPPAGLGADLLQREIGLTVESGPRGALRVASVVPGSPAARKGLRAGDVVLGANGQQLDSIDALGREMVRGVERGGLLLVVQRGPYAYNLGFNL